MTGSLISHYRIIGALGNGGMGVVYQAEDTRLGRFVALKFLPAEFAQDAHTRARFHREARAASALNHPNICTIYEIAEEGDRPFIAMEYIDGASLRQLVEAGPLPLSRLLDIAIDVIKGLEAAHSKGIIHRDIKPANICVTNGGTAKILDFGLAKLMPRTAAGAGGPGAETGNAMHSDPFSTGAALLGTVQYMSPEQVLAKPVDARSDLFSFGVLLYEMATGSLPFRGDSSPAILVSIVHDLPVAPLRLNPNLPKVLARIVARCLEKAPERRYQHAQELRADLEELKRDSSWPRPSRTLRIGRTLDTLASKLSIGRAVSTAPAREPGSVVQRRHARSTRAAVLVSTGAVLLMAFVFGLFHYVGAGNAETLAERDKPQAPLIVRTLTSLPGRKERPIFSPDGNAIAFAWDGGEESRNFDVYLMQLDGGRPIQITNHPAGEWPRAFSPDGRRLYFVRQTEGNYASYWAPALGGEETRVAEGIVTDISPDGRLAALVRPAASMAAPGVFALDLGAGAERWLAKDFGAMDPKFTPDGKGLFVQDGRDRDHLSLHRIPIGGGKPEAARFSGLGADIDRVETVEVAPRRRRMLIGARTKARALISFIANADGSDPKRLPAGVTPGALSPDGRQMIAAGKAFEVNVYRVEAFPSRGRSITPQKVLDTPREEYSPRISPDGKHVVVSSWYKGHWQIWLWNSDFTDGRPVFGREGGTAGSPAWSPDGKWIAFDARTRSASADIWLMPADRGEPRMIADQPGDSITPCFDPAGQWIYFTSSRTGSLQLFRMPLTGGPATQVTRGGGFTCQISADGRYLYYLKTRNGGEIWRLDMATEREEPIVPEMKSRNWKVLKDGIYMLDSRTNSQHGTTARVAEARFYSFATRKIRDLGFQTSKAADSSGVDISPDEKWLYYSQVDSVINELVIAENLPF
jgi:eukaryotic-like serine/threonine-protein kinase